MTDDGVRFVSAVSVSLEAYAAAITAAFAGYYVEVAFTAPILARCIRLEQHALESSVIALEGDEVVGVAGLAVRGRRGWISGFGVVPAWRRRGLGRRLLTEVCARARAAELTQISLEVLVQNTAARALYESAGLRVTRDLLILDRLAGQAPAVAPGAHAPAEAAPAELLQHYWRLHPEPPAWQRELANLATANLHGLYVGERRQPRAYALLGRGRHDGNLYISDLAAADDAAAEEMCAALDHIDGLLKIINEPEQSLFAAPLRAHGFCEVMRQHEMWTEL